MQKKEKDFHLEKATESRKDVDEKVCQHATASIHPSKMQIPDLPFLLMAAHTCTSVGCFGLGLYLGFKPYLYSRVSDESLFAL